MIQHIVKRDGRVVPYDINKIAGAIDKAMKACGRSGGDESMRIAKIVEERVEEDGGEPSVEQIQDVVENVLMECGYALQSALAPESAIQSSRVYSMSSLLQTLWTAI